MKQGNNMSIPIQTVLICGYGVMGRGVAKTFADAGFATVVKSSRAKELKLPANLRAMDRLPAEAPDLAIEFAPEDVKTKQAVYAELEAAYPEANTLIATGTSGLDLVELAHGMKRPERFIGLHYFMPADTTPVVEVMAGLDAPAAAVDRAAEALRRTGKEPVLLYKPIVGFLINRLQHAILHEAYYLIESGVASAADIDHAARRMLAPRMCLNGLIQQKDISGLKIHADAQRSIVPKLFHNGVPNEMLQKMVRRGETGLSAGKGFYDWVGCDAEAVRKQASAQLGKLLAYLDDGLGAPQDKTQPKTR
jgi:3-hydroxybutyryl-CoA dehydrogenase